MKNKSILFLSTDAARSAKDRLRFSGTQYVVKYLESGVSNWNSIIDIFNDVDVGAVLVKLSNSTMLKMVSDEYREIANSLLSHIGQRNHILFMHTSFFETQNSPEEAVDECDPHEWGGVSFDYKFEHVSEENKSKIRNILYSHNINIVPYTRNVELDIASGDFVESIQGNLIFRFYVPNARLYASTISDIVNLFCDYMAKSLHLSVRQSTKKSANGTVYEFFSDGEYASDPIPGRFADFSKIMDLCLINPEDAEKELIRQGANPEEVSRLVIDYAKRFRRINNDMRQDRERVIMDLRHSLENELMEIAPQVDAATIDDLVEHIVPGRSTYGWKGYNAKALTGSPIPSSLVVNLNPQIISHVNGVVTQRINGDIQWEEIPRKVLSLIDQYGDTDIQELREAVYNIEDKDSTNIVKGSAIGKLYHFLTKIGPKFGDKALDIGGGLLQSYLQSKLGLSH